MDIAVLIRWIVVFLVIFVLLMFFVFSLLRKSKT
jgi:competence protein ComGC